MLLSDLPPHQDSQVLRKCRNSALMVIIYYLFSLINCIQIDKQQSLRSHKILKPLANNNNLSNSNKQDHQLFLKRNASSLLKRDLAQSLASLQVTNQISIISFIKLTKEYSKQICLRFQVVEHKLFTQIFQQMKISP